MHNKDKLKTHIHNNRTCTQEKGILEKMTASTHHTLISKDSKNETTTFRSLTRKLCSCRLLGNNKSKKTQRLVRARKPEMEQCIEQRNWPAVLAELENGEAIRADFVCGSSSTLQDARSTSDDCDDRCNILLQCCQRGAPESVVTTIMALYPDMIMAVTRTHGKTPLHAACESASSLGVIECLCDEMLVTSPGRITQKDNAGLNALHYAIQNKNAARAYSFETVSYLRDCYLRVKHATVLETELACYKSRCRSRTDLQVSRRPDSPSTNFVAAKTA
jgi:hypothetical protein